jgi:negative regulator of replication initiation
MDTVNLKDLDAAASQFNALGKNLGDIVRRVLGFTRTESNARKPRNPINPSTPTLFV